MIELVFIGERFYKESQTLMSSIYQSLPGGMWERYDWGKLQLDINAVKNIHFLPATKEEIQRFETKLNETLIKWGYQPGMKAQIHDDTPDFWYAVTSLSKPFVIEEEPPFILEELRQVPAFSDWQPVHVCAHEGRRKVYGFRQEERNGE